MKLNTLTLLFLFVGIFNLYAQEKATHCDSLQGGMRIERSAFNVLHYDLNLTVNPEEKFISGYNEIQFEITANTPKIQLDLFPEMQIDSIIHEGKKLKYQRDCAAVFIDFPTFDKLKTVQKIRFYYSGKPHIARNAPWDGGFVFSKDKSGKPWIGVAVQGTGASLWYPVKDTQTDEPDKGAVLRVAVPNGLMNVSNGTFLGSFPLQNGYTRWDWEVKNPINTYSINLNIADYAHIHEDYNGLNLDYYVLRENEEKARKHFEEVKPMLACFESKFGKYPFPEDGYKLVETPYLGMEHQSCVAYGNKYLQGYLGTDLSGTGVGLLFDFITIHESGHEWFGNSITSADIADMWIHEGFTQYSEAVYVECQFGYDQSQVYLNGLKKNVKNDTPIIGPYGVNKEGSGDMYPKGALLLNTIRHIINDDAKWWQLLFSYAEKFRHKIVTTEDVISYFNQASGKELTPVFNQYLRYKQIPEFHYYFKNKKMVYRWHCTEKNFAMPLDITINGKKTRLYPTSEWQFFSRKIKKPDALTIMTNRFFILSKQVNPIPQG